MYKANSKQYDEWAHSSFETVKSTQSKLLRTLALAPAVYIVGDYDVDGICGTHIAKTSINALFPALPVYTRIPRRFSEGYGINAKIIDEITESAPAGSVLLTVDNGIAAKDVLSVAKERGLTVIVTDHHQLGDLTQLPDVDTVIDPVVEGCNPFNYDGYCGAGVAYQLFKDFLPLPVRQELQFYAALASVCDIMPMTKNNWITVREVLYEMRRGIMPASFKYLLDATNTIYDFINEDTFGYILGPLLNAPGRLDDRGAESVLSYFQNPDFDTAMHLVDINNSRKQVTEEAMAIADKMIQDLGDITPLWLKLDNIPEGLLGLIAGHITEKYKRPAIVCTLNPEKGILKASARSYGGIDIYQYLSQFKDNYLNFGGHPGAAGLSFDEASFEILKQHTSPYQSQELSFDEALNDAEIVASFNEMECARPFGEQNPDPIFRVKITKDIMSSKARFMGKSTGKENTHLSINCTDGSKIVHFSHRFQPASSSLPTQDDIEDFYLYGKIKPNIYQGVQTPQFIASDIERIECK